MSWPMLMAGLALWWGAHMFKRIAPERRAAVGQAGNAVVALSIVGGIVLMVLGYRATEYIPIWTPPSFMVHINNLLILIAIFLMSPAPKRGRLLNGMRHPMLTGFALWAVAHLLVNGDMASLVLFGGLLLWALIAPRVINAAEGQWVPTEHGSYSRDAMFLVASLVLMALIGALHGWLGPSPFPS